MRTLNDLTPAERSAYKVWQSKLRDRTLTAEQHDVCRQEIDNLLWKGPNAQVLELKAELAAVRDRLARIEFHLGLADDALPAPTSDCCQSEPTTVVNNSTKVVRADVTQSTGLKDTAEPTAVTKTEPTAVTKTEPTAVTKTEPAAETRGRKPLRFHPEKDANKRWLILDRDADEYTSHGPYRTRREAKEMADTLNNMPNQPAPGALSEPKDPVEALIDSDTIVGGGGVVVSRVTDNPEETILQNVPAETPQEEGDPLAGLGF